MRVVFFRLLAKYRFVLGVDLICELFSFVGIFFTVPVGTIETGPGPLQAPVRLDMYDL